MTDKEKVIEYELHIVDMMNSIKARLEEFEGKDLNEFEQGRQLAYMEIMDVIKTRHEIILENIE